MAADRDHDEHSAAYRRGMDELRKHLGQMADAHIQKIKALAPEFAWVNVTFPFGELCTIAALTIQGFALPQTTGDQSSPLPP